MQNRFIREHYVIRRKLFTFLGEEFTVEGESGELILFSKKKAFKLREDIRLYSDDSMMEELMTIEARNIIDFAGTYDVYDTVTGEHLGALKRKGWKSMLRDEWLILTPEDEELGMIREDSMAMAFLRRFLPIIPENFQVTVGGELVAEFRQRLSFLARTMDAKFSFDSQDLLDRRMGLAAAILICIIERQQRRG